MKKTLKWIIPAILLVCLIAGAVVIYNNLGDKYKNEGTNQSSQEKAPTPAPDFTVYDKEGNPVRLSDFKGKPVVVNFWTSWCVYCKEEMPDFERLYKENPDVQFMMINAAGEQDIRSEAEKVIKDGGYTFDVFYDNDQSALFSYYVTSFPTTVFVDSEGNFAGRANGMLNYDTVKAVLAKM